MSQSEPYVITHEFYFQEHGLSVEQYGEILVKVAFDGEKMPDNYRGYDIQAKIEGKVAFIEVKSKIAETENSRASVVHCNDNKFALGGMTHLIVILFDRKKLPTVREAWLLSAEQALRLRRSKTKSMYINIRDLRLAAKSQEITCIQEKLQKAAESPVDKVKQAIPTRATIARATL